MRLIEFAVVLAVGITLVPLVAEAQRPSIARVGSVSGQAAA